MQKYIYVSLFIFLMNNVNAQLIIANNQNNVLLSESTLMQFEDGYTNGIILPANDQAPINPTNGTFILDQSDKRVKVFENNQWKNLSYEGNLSDINSNKSDDLGDGVILGSETSNAKGVLVLESDDKSLILPRINDPVSNVKSPYPGMICYDTKSKTICIYDGKVWNFWK